MEGLATVSALGTPLQAWKPTAPVPRMTLSRSPITARMLCTPQPHYPLSLAFGPYRTLYRAPPRICSAYRPCYSNSKQNINDDEEVELKRILTRAGGLVISVAMTVLSLQGMFCRPAFAARSWPSTPTPTSTSTSSPEFDSVQEEDISKIFEEILQPLHDEGTNSENPSPNANPSPNQGTMPDQEELVNAFRRLPTEFQKEVVKRTLMAPIVAGNIDMAVDMLDSLIQERPHDVDWKLMKGYVLDDADRADESKLTFEQILQEDPYNAHALQGLAIVMHKLGEDAAMIKMLEELVQKAQELQGVGAAYNMKLVLAHAYIVQDNLEGALTQYQHLIDENPQDFRAYLCQGIIYSVLDKKDEANERFEKYNKLVPDSFSKQEFRDDVMLTVKTESEKLSEARKRKEKLLEEGKSPDEAKQSGKPMQQPRFR